MKSAKKRAKEKRRSPVRLRLYVADTSARSILAMVNVQTFCERYLQHGYKLRIIDIVKDPVRAFRDDILATPTLMRVAPGPPKIIIGTFSDAQHVLRALELGSHAEPSLPPGNTGATFIQSIGTA
jgi:circadian clock protein KaiB